MAVWHFSSFAESLRARRFRWPLLVLLASIGLTAIAAIEAQRAVRSQHAVAERALQEYASFGAWSFAQHLSDTLNAVEREAVGAVNHGDHLHMNPTVPVAHDLVQYLPWNSRCMCNRAEGGPNPDSFFAFKVGTNSLDIGGNDHVGDMMDSKDARQMDISMSMSMLPPVDPAPSYTPGEKRWLLDSLTRRIRGLGEPDHGFTLVVGRVRHEPQIYAYTLMPTSWGDTMVYGARYSQASLVRLLDGVLDGSGLLPATFTAGRRNRDVLAVRLRDRDGNLLYDSAPGVSSPLDAHVELPSRAGLLAVDAVIRPELAGTLIIGGLPASRLPFLFGLLGLAAALSIVAVMQLRREGELAQLRGDFVSSVSHELRTPLAQIRLYLETLQLGRASTDEQRQWSLNHIERETTRLSHLVENVLRFSTLGRADPTRREPTDVSAEVARIAAEFRPLAASRRAAVCVTARETPPVALRPDSLRHIVLNLLDNAVKYGPPGQTVNIVVDADNKNVLISVADEGPGISAGDHERIWRAFTRGPTAQASGGSGIGLTIVREVAEAHGGSAQIQDTARGARFVVALPFGSEPSPVAS